MAKMSGEGNQIPGHSWASFLKDNTPSSSENVRTTEKRRKSGDMHTKLTLGDKPLLGDMPKVEEFSTVCCRLCKWPVKTQSVKEHMALRHPDYSAARLREEAERFQVKIMINSIPESLFAAVPSYKSHMLSPVHVTSPVAPCVPDVVDEDTAAVVDLLGSLAPVPAAPTPTPTPPPTPAPEMPAAFAVPPAPPVTVKEEPPDVKPELLDGVEVVSSEEQMGAVLSLKTEVPGAFVDILNEFESDAGAADDETETAAAVAALAAITASPAPPEPEPPACVFSPPPPPQPQPPPPPPPPPPLPLPLPPPAPVAAPPPLALSPRVPSKAEFKSVPSSPSRPLAETPDASSISEHFAKMRAGGNGGSLCSKKSRLGQGSQPRQYDPRKHCGVWITERSKNCTRVLDCRQHNLEQKSKVPRPLPFKDLLARFKAGKPPRERDTVKPMSMRYDPKFVPPEGHPAAAGAASAPVSPSRSGGMVTYHNITNSPVFRRDRSGSADDDGMPPPSSVPPRAAASSACPPPPPPPPPPEICVPRMSSYPQPLAVGGAARLSVRGGCLSLVDQTSQLRAAFRSMFQPARRGQQSLLKMNQTRVSPTAASAAAASAVASATVTATANGQLTPGKRPPEPPLGALPAVKKQRPAAAAGAAPVAARPPAPAAAAASSPLTLQQTGTTAAVNAVLAAAAAAATGGGGSSAGRLQHQHHQQQQQHQQHHQQQHALLNLQQGGRNVTLGQVGGLQTQQVNIQLPKGGLPSNIRLTLPSSALSHLQGISNDTKMIAINSNKVPINRVGPAGAGAVSLGQRVARIGAPSTLPVHHLSQQVLGQIQIPRLPGSAGGLTFKVQQQGGLVMRPEQS